MSRQFVLCAAFLVFCGSSWAQNKATQTIVINYPQNETIFPPDLAPPTFLWTDASDSSVAWQVEVKFSNSQTLKLIAAGERMRIGEIDERAIADTNEPPKLTAEQALMRTWKPDSDTWTH
ncbi:MAG TPA: hypothetical protein VEQ63_02900, partial [Bryobacteraceae bacterium]|nr:hypothetical protein [Bryobacteraceae bacterium]